MSGSEDRAAGLVWRAKDTKIGLWTKANSITLFDENQFWQTE